MDNKNVYSPPRSKVSDGVREKTPKKASMILIVLSVLLVIINGYITLVLVKVSGGTSATTTQGYIIGQVMSVVILPLIIVGLFQIGKGFRNSSSRVKVFFWASCFILLSKFGNLLPLVQQA